MSNLVDYKTKYLIYKNKYLNLKNKQTGGANAAQEYSPAQLYQAMMHNYNSNLANGLPVAELSGEARYIKNWENINLNDNIEQQLKTLINTQFADWVNNQDYDLIINGEPITRANLTELIYNNDSTIGDNAILLLYKE